MLIDRIKSLISTSFGSIVKFGLNDNSLGEIVPGRQPTASRPRPGYWPPGAVLVGALLLSACSTAPLRPVGDATPYEQTAVAVAKEMLGVRYRYGGEDPRHGFDCSGLVYYSYRRAGLSVPRVAGEQYMHTQPVYRDALRPGDLVFFRTGRRLVSHVGIYIGRGRFIHAPSSGQRVSIDSLDEPYWRRHYVRGGRFAAQLSSNP